MLTRLLILSPESHSFPNTTLCSSTTLATVRLRLPCLISKSALLGWQLTSARSLSSFLLPRMKHQERLLSSILFLPKPRLSQRLFRLSSPPQLLLPRSLLLLLRPSLLPSLSSRRRRPITGTLTPTTRTTRTPNRLPLPRQSPRLLPPLLNPNLLPHPSRPPLKSPALVPRLSRLLLPRLSQLLLPLPSQLLLPLPSQLLLPLPSQLLLPRLSQLPLLPLRQLPPPSRLPLPLLPRTTLPLLLSRTPTRTTTLASLEDARTTPVSPLLSARPVVSTDALSLSSCALRTFRTRLMSTTSSTLSRPRTPASTSVRLS
jgi:hypothetical protein